MIYEWLRKDFLAFVEFIKPKMPDIFTKTRNIYSENCNWIPNENFYALLYAEWRRIEEIKWSQDKQISSRRKNFYCQVSFEIQRDPTPKVSEIEAYVLYFIWKIKSHPTHTYNFSHEGKKDSKVGLPMQ